VYCSRTATFADHRSPDSPCSDSNPSRMGSSEPQGLVSIQPCSSRNRCKIRFALCRYLPRQALVLVRNGIDAVCRSMPQPDHSGNVTVAYTGATVSPTPVSLSGTAAANGTLSFTSATNGTLSGTGTRTLTFTILNPRAPVTSVVTITNSGGAPLSITAENLPVNIGGLYSIRGSTVLSRRHWRREALAQSTSGTRRRR
jgi:hypothetical protein